MRTLLLAIAVAAAATGCASWIPGGDRMDVQQGNILSAADLEELRTGLSRARVRALLGTPVLGAPFHPQRWDYLYYEVEAGREVSAQRLTLFFEGDTLARIVRRYEPPDPQAVEDLPDGPVAPPDATPSGPQRPPPQEPRMPGPSPLPGAA